MMPSSATRRSFLRTSSLLVAAPLILPRRLRAAGTSPNGRITLGCIGTGRMMRMHFDSLLARDDIQVVAVCDVDTTRREQARRRVDDTYSEHMGATYKSCTAHNDFRELLARPDIDAVFIATSWSIA